MVDASPREQYPQDLRPAKTWCKLRRRKLPTSAPDVRHRLIRAQFRLAPSPSTGTWAFLCAKRLSRSATPGDRGRPVWARVSCPRKRPGPFSAERADLPRTGNARVTPKARCRSKGFAVRSVAFIRWTALRLSWERRDTSTKRNPPRERCGSFVAPTISNPGGALSPSQIGATFQSARGGTPTLPSVLLRQALYPATAEAAARGV